MSYRIMGVDPGVTGGYAVIEGIDTIIEIGDLEVHSIGSTNQIDPYAFDDLLTRIEPNIVVLEDNRAIGINGSKANYSMGLSMGIILGAVAGHGGISLARIRPNEWQAKVALTSVPAIERKNAHRARARELWPTHAAYFSRQKDHNRADAALIAEGHRRIWAPAG